MTTTSHVLIYSELLTEGTSDPTQGGGDAKTEERKKYTFYTLRTVERNRFPICLIQEISEMARECTSVWEG